MTTVMFVFPSQLPLFQNTRLERRTATNMHGNPDTEALQYTPTFCLFIYMIFRQEMVSKSNVRECRNHDVNAVETAGRLRV